MSLQYGVLNGAVIYAILLLSAAPAPAQAYDDGCEQARLSLESFLSTLPRTCETSSDCQAYDLWIDVCDPPVVLAKPGVPASKAANLARLRAEAGRVCKWSGLECAMLPEPACVKNRCVDENAKSAMDFSPANYTFELPAHNWPHALVMHSCAPWDGPALGIILTEKPASCAKTAAPYLSIYIWRDLPSGGPKTIEFKEGGDNGGASRCMKANECERATNGRVSFVKFDENGNVQGTYEFHFKDGSVEQGTFNAEWCHERELCG